MALTFSRWLAGAAIGASAITAAAVVYDARERDYHTRPFESPRSQATQARARFVRAYWRWRSLERRDSILRSLARSTGRLALDAPVVRAGTGIDSHTVALVDRLARRQWSALEIGSARSPLVIAVVAEDAGQPDFPTVGGFAFDYIVPDGEIASPCITVLILERSADPRTVVERGGRSLGHPRYAPALLGPCAFHARFGRPGPDVERWLTRRRYDVASTPAWTSTHGSRPDSAGGVSDGTWRRRSAPADVRSGNPLGAWPLSPAARACLAGIHTTCVALIAAPEGESANADRVISRQWVNDRDDAFAPADYLSDLASYLGPARFERFWRSSSTVGEAIAEATGMSLGPWTEHWGRAYYADPPRIGPSIMLTELGFTIALILGALGVVVIFAQRRQQL